jgi:hypothetical protein
MKRPNHSLERTRTSRFDHREFIALGRLVPAARAGRYGGKSA